MDMQRAYRLQDKADNKTSQNAFKVGGQIIIATLYYYCYYFDDMPLYSPGWSPLGIFLSSLPSAGIHVYTPCLEDSVISFVFIFI